MILELKNQIKHIPHVNYNRVKFKMYYLPEQCNRLGGQQKRRLS